MRAGPHIQAMVALHRSIAEQCRKDAEGIRARAERLERRAVAEDAAADRWAAGTDLEGVKAPIIPVTSTT